MLGEHSKLPFGKLLEKYVFSVASEFIGFVDSETQTRLIRLLININNGPVAEEKQLKAEINAIEDVIASRQITINRILSFILRVDILIDKAE